eukprot:g57.t1
MNISIDCDYSNDRQVVYDKKKEEDDEDKSRWHYKVIDKFTRSKRLIRVCREHYLRDDISAGSLLLPEDEHLSTVVGKSSQISLLSKDPFGNRYVMLDTNVVLHQMDLLEIACPAFCDVIIPQTVVGEVFHRDLVMYKRLNALIENTERRFYVFANEHNRGSFQPQQSGESPNDYNDRLIRLAAEWYERRLEGTGVHVLLLTNDRDNCRKAKESGIVRAMTLHRFVDEELTAHFPTLKDHVAAEGVSSRGDTRRRKRHRRGKRPDVDDSETLFPRYWSVDRVKQALQEGEVVSGTIRQNRYSREKASITWFDKNGGASGEKLVRLNGRRAINRAIDGDIVAVEILDNDNDENVENAAAKSSGEGARQNLQGRVVAVLKRNWRPYCGTILEDNLIGGSSAVFVPKDRRIPRIRFSTRQRSTIEAKWIVVAIDEWEENSPYPRGHYVRTIGDVHDRKVESEVILLEHAIPCEAFAPAVIACLPPTDWKITAENTASTRIDLRHLCVCSIDPPGCKDIDDALHARMLPNGLVEVGVHIADVSFYVRPDSALDHEAAKRATTTYITERRLDMLPKLLTETLCSVRSNVDRFVFSAVWEMRLDTAEIVSERFHRSIVHSKRAMTYGQAQEYLDDPSKTGDVATSVRLLNKIAKLLKQKRIDAGALNLASAEVRFQLDSETSDPLAVEMYKHKDTNSLVEEMMLLANIAVAKKITSFFPSVAVLRRHPSPSPRRFDEFVRASKLVGVDIKVDTSKALADSLDRAQISGRSNSNRLFRILATRCMSQAVYFCSGEVKEADRRHYGLATPIYTHFTSPIRRFPDVLAHRMLAVAIGVEPLPKDYDEKSYIRALMDNCNRRHYAAQMAGRESVQLYTRVFFRTRPRVIKANILAVRPTGVSVLVMEFGFEGFVRLKSVEEGGPWMYDEETMSLSRTRGGSSDRLAMFGEVDVRIEVRVQDAYREEVVVSLAEDEAGSALTGSDRQVECEGEKGNKKRRRRK